MSTLTLPEGLVVAAPAKPASSRKVFTALSSKVQLGELLLRSGHLTQDELEAALSEHKAKGLKLGEALLHLGFVSEETLLRCLGQQLNIPFIRVREGTCDPAVVKLVPRPKAEAYCALAMFLVRGKLTVAMAEPQNLQHIDDLERITGYQVRPVLAARSSLESLIPRCYEDNFSVDAVTADIAQDAVTVEQEALELDLGDLASLAEGSPIINLVNYLIVNAIRYKASDIHVEPGHDHSIVRYRVDGQLREMLRPRKDFHPTIVSRLKVMAKLDIAEHRVPQDGRIHVIVEGRKIDLRVSTLPTILGEKIVMRVLDRRNVTYDLDRLGVGHSQLTRLKEILHRPHGLMLVTGPTGSGKTTTLYSSIELIKSVNLNIVTVEDPVEYQLEQINQVQVGSNKAMSFANALRSILRQDPDVIMVGEIRDADTAAVAIQASLTGHLVLSTLHTNDCTSAVIRLRDMGIESFKIAAALTGVVAQRLARTICPHCKASYYPPVDLLQMLRVNDGTRRQFIRGEGCRECFDTGCKGRIGLYEILWMSREMRDLVSTEADLEKLRQCHLDQGGTSLLREGVRLAEEGTLSLEEVARVVVAD
jgi:type IV pilus assembly protein PilB